MISPALRQQTTGRVFTLPVSCPDSMAVPASLPGGRAGPLTGVIPAARALSRQRREISIPSWVLATKV
jgi:hypothetical protein